jgi:ATP-dependent DNA ligase
MLTIEGEDATALPLLERKRQLLAMTNGRIGCSCSITSVRRPRHG